MTREYNPATKPVEPTPRLKTRIWLALLLTAAIAWAIILQYSLVMGGMGQGMATMSMQPESALIFLPLWISMMVAMMFPAVAPVVSLFASISRQRRMTEAKAAPTWIFLAGYLAIWTLFGIVAYLLSIGVPALSMMAAGLRADHPIVAGVVLLLAGVYQISPLRPNQKKDYSQVSHGKGEIRTNHFSKEGNLSKRCSKRFITFCVSLTPVS